MKKVIITAEFVNLVPAHARYITKEGEGTSMPVAIDRAVKAIFKDERLKRKRVALPIKMVIQDPSELGGD